MASPQVENGHIDLALEIAENFYRLQLSGNEWRLLFVILRQTYGWKKKTDKISISFFERKTGLKRRHVVRGLKDMVKRQIITKNDTTFVSTYGFQKDYSKWELLPKRTLLPKMTLKPLPKLVLTKDTQKKLICPNSLPAVSDQQDSEKSERPAGKREPKLSEDSTPYKLARYLWKLIQENFPKIKPPDLQKWTQHIDRMIRLDKRNPDDIGRVIAWAQRDSFWKSNILSTEKLRKQFDVLQAKMGGLND